MFNSCVGRRRFLGILAVASALPFSGCLLEDVSMTDWECFGYDIQNTAYTSDPGPVDGYENKWIYETDNEIRSSPSVADRTVCIGGLDGKMYLFDSETGDIEWTFRIHGEDESDGDWLEFMEIAIDSTPCLTDEAVFFGGWNGYLYSLDRQTGKENWRFRTPEIIRSSPVVDGDLVYIGDWTGGMNSVDIETGSEVWRYETGKRRVIHSTPCVADGILYFGVGKTEEEGRGYRSVGGSIRAIGTDEGSENWVFQTDDAVTSSPAYSDGVVYFGSHDGTVYGLSSDDGSVMWRFETEGDILGSPAVDDNHLYIADQAGGLHALDKENGDRSWLYEMDTRPYESNVTVTDVSVYFGDDDGVHCLDKEGNHHWTAETGGLVRSRPTVVGGSVYFGSEDGKVYAVGDEAEARE